MISLLLIITIGIGHSQSIRYDLEEYTTNDGLLDNSITDIAISSDDQVYIANRQQILRYDNGEFVEVKNLRGLPRVFRIFIDHNNILWVIFTHNNHQNRDSKFALFDANDNFNEVDKIDYISNIEVLIDKSLFRIILDINKVPFVITRGKTVFKIEIANKAEFTPYKDQVEVLEGRYIKPSFIQGQQPHSFYKPKLISDKHYGPNKLDIPHIPMLKFTDQGKTVSDLKEDGLYQLLRYWGWECNARNGETEELFFSNKNIIVYNREREEFLLLSSYFPQYF